MKATKKFRQLAAFFMAVIVVLSGFSIPVNAAGEGKALNTLTFCIHGRNDFCNSSFAWCFKKKESIKIKSQMEDLA